LNKKSLFRFTMTEEAFTLTDKIQLLSSSPSQCMHQPGRI